MGDSSPPSSALCVHPTGNSSHELLQCGSLFHRMLSFRHSLLQCGSSTESQVLQETCSIMDSSLLHGSAGPCQQPAPGQVSHGGTVSSQAFTFSSLSLLPGLQVDLSIPVVLHGLQGHSCLTMAFLTDCKGISALTPGASPHPPSSGTLVSA